MGVVVPRLVRELLGRRASTANRSLQDFEVLTSAGAPLFAEEKREALRKLTPRFHEMYGASAIGPVAALRPEEIAERPTSVGRPILLVDVEVVDDEERPLGANEAGRLRCRGPGLTSPIAGLPV